MLSVQSTESTFSGISNSLLTILSRRKETVAAESSKRRTETAFKGATRNFPKSKGQRTLPLLLTK